MPYLNALALDFALDDFAFILRNPRIMGTDSALGLFTSIHPPDLYRPLTLLTYAVNAAVDSRPVLFHLVNVALHVAVSVIVFRLADVLLGGVEVGAAVGALFAVHPLHTEAVTNVVGRAELLAALFGLLSLLALVRAERLTGGRRVGASMASAGLYLGAMLSKESGITVVALGCVVVLWIRASWDPRPALRLLAPHAIVFVAYVGWRAWLVGSLTTGSPPPFGDNPLAHMNALSRVAAVVVVLGQYLVQLTMPLTLSSDYSFNQIPVVVTILDSRLLGASAGLTALVLAVALAVRRAPQLALAAAFFFIPLAVTANVAFPIGTIRAERLLYLPSVGWCMAAGWLLMMLVRIERPLGLATVGVVVALFAVRTWTRNDDWKDNATVFAAMVRTAPASAKAHANWGFELLGQRRLDEAIRHLQTSVEIAPDWAGAQANLASALARAGRTEDALRHYELAVRLEPDNALIHAGLGLTLIQRGRNAEALDHLATAARLDPTEVTVRYALGLLQLRMGKTAEASEQFAAVVRLNPRHADAFANWGASLLREGRTDDAIAKLEIALRLNPGHRQAQENLRLARSPKTP